MNLLVPVALVGICGHIALTPQTDQIQDGGQHQSPPTQYQNDASRDSVTKPGYDGQKWQKKNTDQRDQASPFLTWCERYEILINLICALFVALFTGVLTMYTVKQSKHSERELRAYVFYRSADLARPEDFSEITARVTMLNSGQTPAYDVRFAIEAIVAENDRRKFPVPDFEPSVMTLGPEVTYTMERRLILDARQQSNIRTGSECIYVFGRLKYFDTFKREHFTNFRMYYSIRGKPGPLPENVLPLEPCAEGNDTSQA